MGAMLWNSALPGAVAGIDPAGIGAVVVFLGAAEGQCRASVDVTTYESSKGDAVPKKFPSLYRGVALSRSERKQIGPIQIVVVGFEGARFEADVLPELERLSELEVIRLVDLLIAVKTESGELVRMQAPGLDEKVLSRFDGVAELLVGLDAPAADASVDEAIDPAPPELRASLGDEHTWSVADVIPVGVMCVVALIEHRWAIPLRDAVQRSGGEVLADAWIDPQDPLLSNLESA